MKIINKLQAFFDSGRPVALVLSVVLSVLLITGLVQAASTISTNITTDGKITGNYASSTVLSVNNTAFFGGTASTTIDVAGNIVGPGTISIAGSSVFGRASTTVFSVNNTAFFGGTATTTINSAGDLLVMGSSTIQDFSFRHATSSVTGGTVAVTSGNSATSTLTVGCIQTYATSTATAVKLRFFASTTLNIDGAAVTNVHGPDRQQGLVLWSYGTCP